MSVGVASPQRRYTSRPAGAARTKRAVEQVVEQAVAEAEARLDRVRLALDSRGDDVRPLRAAADGAARLVRSLASLADNLAEHVSTGVFDRRVADDLLADLKALRNCLATGAALVDPALADLRDPTEPFDVDSEFTACWQEWVAAAGDAGER